MNFDTPEPSAQQIEAFKEIAHAVGDEAMPIVVRALIHGANNSVKHVLNIIHDNLDEIVDAVSADLGDEQPTVDRVIVETIRAVLAVSSAVTDDHWPIDDDMDYKEMVASLKEAAGDSVIH